MSRARESSGVRISVIILSLVMVVSILPISGGYSYDTGSEISSINDNDVVKAATWFQWYIQAGWNEISIPMDPVNKGFDGIFGAFDIINETEQDLGFALYSVMDRTGGNPSLWTSFDAGSPEGVANDFPTDSVHGYRLFSPGPAGVVIVDALNSSQSGVSNVVNLDAGWNLLGFTHDNTFGPQPGGWNSQPTASDFTDGTIDPGLATVNYGGFLTKIIATWWNAGTQSYLSYVDAWNFGGMASKNWTYDTSFAYGYWLWVSSPVVITFDVAFGIGPGDDASILSNPDPVIFDKEPQNEEIFSPPVEDPLIDGVYYFKTDGSHGWGHEGINQDPPENMGSPEASAMATGDEPPTLMKNFYMEDPSLTGVQDLSGNWDFFIDLWEDGDITGDIWAEVKVNGGMNYTPTIRTINSGDVTANTAPGDEIAWTDSAVVGLVDFDGGDVLTVEIWFDALTGGITTAPLSSIFSESFPFPQEVTAPSMLQDEFWVVNGDPLDSTDIRVGDYNGPQPSPPNSLQFRDSDLDWAGQWVEARYGGGNNWFDLTPYSDAYINFSVFGAGFGNINEGWRLETTTNAGGSWNVVIEEVWTVAVHDWQTYSYQIPYPAGFTDQFSFRFNVAGSGPGDIASFDDITVDVRTIGALPWYLHMGYDSVPDGTNSRMQIWYNGDGFPPVSTINSLSVDPYVGVLPDDVVLSVTGNDTTTGGSNVIAAEYRVDGGGWIAMTPGPIGVVTDFTATLDLHNWTLANHDIEVRVSDGNWSSPDLYVYNVADTTDPLHAYAFISPPDGATRGIGSLVDIRVDYEDFTDYTVAEYYYNENGGPWIGPLAMTDEIWMMGSNIHDFSFQLTLATNGFVEYYYVLEDANGSTVTGVIRTLNFGGIPPPIDPYPVYGFTTYYNGAFGAMEFVDPAGPDYWYGRIDPFSSVDITWYNRSLAPGYETISVVSDANGQYSQDIWNYTDGDPIWVNGTSAGWGNNGYNYTFVDIVGAPGGRRQDVMFGIPYDVVITDYPAQINISESFSATYEIQDIDGMLAQGYYSHSDGAMDWFSDDPSFINDFAHPRNFNGFATGGTSTSLLTFGTGGIHWLNISEGGNGEGNPYLTPWGAFDLQDGAIPPNPGYLKDWDNVSIDVNASSEPDIWVTPDSFNFTVNVGGTDNDNLTIGNNGTGDLFYNITHDGYFGAPAFNPIAHWTLDETIGTTAYDEVGTNDGNNLGALINQPGMNGTSYNFDGFDDYISVGDDDLLDFTNGEDFSIYAWVKHDSLSPPDYPMIINKRAISDGVGYQLYLSASDRLVANLDHGVVGSAVTGTTDIADGNWHHVGMTREGNTLRLYVDGFEEGTPSTSSGGDISNSNTLKIGRLHTSAYYWDGNIDDVRFYDQAILPGQVYSSGISWLTVTPENGSLNPSQSTDHTVTVDASTLSAGFYQANISIESNDPDENPVIVPVNLTVLGAQPSMTITKSAPATAVPGEMITYWLNYTNVGSDWAYNVTITETYPANVTFISAIPIPDIPNNVWIIPALAPGASGSIQITVQVSPAAISGTWLVNNVTLDYEDGIGTPYQDWDTASTLIMGPIGDPDIWTIPGSFDFTVNVGGTDNGNLTIGNNGNGDLYYNISVYDSIIPPIYSENFDSQTVGTSPPNGFIIDSNKPIQISEVSNSQSHSGPNSMYLLRTGGAADWGYARIEQSFTNEKFSAWVYFDTNNDYRMLSFQDSPGNSQGANTITIVYFDSNSIIRYYNGTSLINSPFTYDVGWHLIEVIHNFTSKTYKIFYDGSKITSSWDPGFYKSTATSVEAVHFGCSNVIGDSRMWIDDITIGDNGILPPDWLTVTPENGSLNPSQSTGHTVTVDASNLSAGFYQANISIESNDPDENPVIVPVNLTVLGAQPSMTITKSAPATAHNGDFITYGLNYTNVGSDWAYNVVITELFPPGVTFISSIPNPDVGNNVWFIGSAPPGGSGTIFINVTIDLSAFGTLTNTVTLEYENAAIPMENETAWANTTIINPQMVISKTAPATASPGETIMYTLTYQNIGSDTAYNVTITEIYPIDGTFVDSNPPPDIGDNIWLIGDVPPGAIGTIYINFSIDPAATGTLNNSVSLDYENTVMPMPTEWAYAETTILSGNLNMTFTKSGPSTANPGDTIMYSLSYQNTGVETAYDVWITETYPVNVTFVDSNPVPSYGNNEWDVGDLAPGESGTIFINVTIDGGAAGDLVNQAQLEYDDGVGVGQPPEISIFLTTIVNPDMTVSKSAPATANTGDFIIYTINYTNIGDDWAYNVTITETYPANVSYISAIPAPTVGNNVWIIPAVAPGGSGSIQVTVQINPNAPESLLNFVQLEYNNSLGTPQNTVNDTASTLVLDESTPPQHSNESPPINGYSAVLDPIISVHVTDLSGLNTSTIRLYVNGFPIFYSLTPIPNGYNVSYWHAAGFIPDEVVTIRIVAEDTLGNLLDFSWQFTNPSVFQIDLEAGWNLVSFPLIQFNNSILNVLSSIAGQWESVQYYDATDNLDHWKTYSTLAPVSVNDLLELDNTMGFWLFTTQATTLSVTGITPMSTQIQLYAGWNLVSYPSLTQDTVANALWGTGADMVAIGNASNPYNLENVGPTYMMKPGEGYWVHVPADTVWVVDW